jgi:hypothetical protein
MTYQGNAVNSGLMDITSRLLSCPANAALGILAGVIIGPAALVTFAGLLAVTGFMVGLFLS